MPFLSPESQKPQKEENNSEEETSTEKVKRTSPKTKTHNQENASEIELTFPPLSDLNPEEKFAGADNIEVLEETTADIETTGSSEPGWQEPELPADLIEPPDITEDSSEPFIPPPSDEATSSAVLKDFFQEPENRLNPQTDTAPQPQFSNGPLAGIRVLDLTHFYPGPLATMMMADLGADVIKIEDVIKPDKMREYPPLINGESAGFMAVNRSKRCISIKFNEEDGQDIFFQLLRKADIVIEQFNPGVLDGIGMGYIEAIKVNPKIIYVSLTGYGQSGPYANKAGHDINYIGYSGILGATANENGGKAIPGAQFADASGAYMAIIGSLSALWARERTGIGQKVDVSMLDALLPMMTMQMAQFWATSSNLSPWEMPFSGGLPYYNIYECKDGKYVALGALEPKFWIRLCEIAGKPKWAGRIAEKGRNRETLKKELARLFKTRSRDEWIELVGNSETCLTPVLEISEIEYDNHLRERGMIIEHEHPLHGRIKGIGIPIKFSHTKTENPTPCPSLGENSVEILRELDYSESKINHLLEKGVVLSGD